MGGRAVGTSYLVEPSYLNHTVAQEEKCPSDGSDHHGSHSAQHDPAEAAVVLQDPIFQGRAME